MTRLDEPVDPATLVLTARRSVRAHTGGRLCHLQCPGDDRCRQLEWAVETLAAYRQDPGERTARGE